MRARLALIATIALLLGLLVILNAASYVYKNESAVDSELNPNRSSYHEGSTGTRGLFEFLQQSDYRVVRWRKSLVSLLDGGASRPHVLLVIGGMRIPFDENEHVSLARWVGEGGRLVIVDRELAPELRRMLAGWHLSARTLAEPSFTLGEEKPEAVIEGVSPLSPAQPTLLTREVKAMRPSRYAARLTLSATTAGEEDDADEEETDGELSSPTPIPAAADDEGEEAPLSTAPVVHFSDKQGALLVDHSYGRGRIMLLSDPFVLANNGIARADNLQLALNMIGNRERGLVAFDEYHHGHGAAHETLITYFAGTPVPVFAAQLVLLMLAFVWARGRRFARALPAPQVDRRSKLEFITSMAELQMRARAFDLALENIYARTRRVLARVSGTEASASRERIAVRVADQSGRISKEELEKIMRACDEAIAGAPTNGKRALELAAELRRVERLLGAQTRRRELKQGFGRMNDERSG